MVLFFPHIISLHVHPFLGNWLVNKFPKRLILGKQYVVRLRNNSGKRRSAFYVVHSMPSAKQQNCKHVYNNRYFLGGPCRICVGVSVGHLQSVTVRSPESRTRSRHGKEM
jgi:hypothetical protein